MHEKVETLRHILQALQGKLDLVMTADNAVETKASVVAGLNFTFFAYAFNSLIRHGIVVDIIPLCYIIFLLFLVSSFSYWQLLKSRVYNSGVPHLEAHPEYLSMNEGSIILQLISDYQAAFDENSQILFEKTAWFRRAVGLLVASVMSVPVIQFFI